MRSLVLLTFIVGLILINFHAILGFEGPSEGKNIKRFIKAFTELHRSTEIEYDKDLDSIVSNDLNDTEIDVLFQQFLLDYRKPYGQAENAVEYSIRKAIFVRNMLKINLLNYLEQGTAVYGINEFADMDDHEFIQHKLGYRRSMRGNLLEMEEASMIDKANFSTLWEELLEEEGTTEDDIIFDAPESFDWRKKSGVVSSVKNQGNCGSCWAFSTTGNIEGQLKIKKNLTVSLSEEELVDCDTVDFGCNGGLPQQAFDQVIKLGGLETESDYPYNPRHKKGCRMANKAPKYTITSFVDLPKDEQKLKVWLTKRGPISIGVNAYAMQWYRHGVSHPWKLFCNPLMLDHAVLIVGYGVEKSKKGLKPYWIIKNSWGTNWGEQGYYRLYRGKNVCGVAEDCSSAIISK